MSQRSVIEALRRFGAEERIINMEVSTATVALAAEALGVEEARIAKTLSFLLDDRCILVVMAGDVKTDNAKFKAAFHKKAKMVPGELVEELTGHPVGGVCPFGVKEGVEVYLDRSLERFVTVFPAAGSTVSAIELTLDELYTFSGALGWVDVSKF